MYSTLTIAQVTLSAISVGEAVNLPVQFPLFKNVGQGSDAKTKQVEMQAAVSAHSVMH